METQRSILPGNHRNTLGVAALAGAVYLVTEIILGAMDVAWFAGDRGWGFKMNAVYTGLTILMAVSFVLFARGFIVLSNIFENTLLKGAAYMLIAAVVGKGILDISTLSVEDVETLWIPYAAVSVLFGALSIVFGVALIRLQDGMGELARVAGLLEIIMGCLFTTVALFFLAYVILIPALVVEILLIYRGYEYLSKSESVQMG